MAKRRKKFLFTRKRRYHKRNPYSIKLKKQTIYTIAAIWLWIVAGAVTLSFFGEGTILTLLRDQLSTLVGWGMYAFPPILVSASFLLFKVKTDIGKPHVPLGLGLLFVTLLGLTRAGDLGALLWNTISVSLSSEGAALVLTGLFVVGIIVLFNTSLDSVVNFLFVGLQGLMSLIRTAGKGVFKKSRDFGQTKFSYGSKDQDERPFSKAPMVPPTVPAKARGANEKSDILISQPSDTTDIGVWEYPSIGLLADTPGEKADRGDVKKNADVIEKTLDSFGVKAEVVDVKPAPAVTQYAIRIPLGIKVSKVTALSSDLALALAAPTGQVRIEAPIPGKDLVGIEVPNRGLEFVTLKRMLESNALSKAKSKLAVALGLDVSGQPVVADIARMPHVLVAGTTGSGKSVLINAWICSLLYRTTPQEVRLILVDPKRVELTGYNGIPHLLTPVIVEQDKILSALRWAMMEMDRRYKQFQEVGVRNIDGYNELSGFQSMPFIVIFIDELNDLMSYAPVEVEDTICRIAQMARATGIHLVVSTQRPSVDVITGLIKANISCRIAFNVSSMVDSRVILDMPGAEKLLGRGDMLYVPPDQSKPSRIQGTYVSDAEVKKVVEFLRTKNKPAAYSEEVTSQPVTGLRKGSGIPGIADTKDLFFEDALRLVCQYDKASASLLQRRLSVGYARAARILDQLEEEGIIGPGEGSKPRDVLVKNPDEYLAQQAQAQQEGDRV